jgi:hypothetical protein
MTARVWAAELGGLLGAPQALAAAVDGGGQPREVQLEGAEELAGVVLGATTQLALPGAGRLDELLRRTVGVAYELNAGRRAVSRARASR